MPSNRRGARRAPRSARATPAPAPSPTPDPLYKIDPLAHVKWAKALARVVRMRPVYGFTAGSAQEEDLEGVALEALCRLAIRFDPARTPMGRTHDRQFQIWSRRAILKECERAADKLVGGGMYRAATDKYGTRIAKLPRPGGLPDERCANCADVVGSATGLVWLDRPWHEDEPEPMPNVIVEEKSEQSDALAEAIAVAKAQK